MDGARSRSQHASDVVYGRRDAFDVLEQRAGNEKRDLAIGEWKPFGHVGDSHLIGVVVRRQFVPRDVHGDDPDPLAAIDDIGERTAPATTKIDDRRAGP